MSTLEIVLNMLAEASTTELTKAQNPQGLDENLEIAQAGGRIAGTARTQIEEKTGKPVITSDNAAQLNRVVTDLIENVSGRSASESEDRKLEK